MNAIDELGQRRQRHRFESQPFKLECDTLGCPARGIFDSTTQMVGWRIATVPDPESQTRKIVVVHCPRCAAANRQAKR